jgi:RNA polymerase sigma factor (sigma-70 family)
MSCSDPTAAAILMAEQYALVWEAVDSLAPNLREVIVMRLVQGISRQEIAARLNISVKAVEQRYTRGFAALLEHPCVLKLVAAELL